MSAIGMIRLGDFGKNQIVAGIGYIQEQSINQFGSGCVDIAVQ
jgi:hypothetical protein